MGGNGDTCDKVSPTLRGLLDWFCKASMRFNKGVYKGSLKGASLHKWLKGFYWITWFASWDFVLASARRDGGHADEFQFWVSVSGALLHM